MPSQRFDLISQAGVRRDGTVVDSPYYSDGVWMRFQRGKARKMGGYRAMSTLANGPVRALMVDSRNGINSVHTFSPWGVQRLQFNQSGAGGNLEDRTPASFIADPKLTWSYGVMTSSSGGSFSALLAASSPDVDQIDSDDKGFVYSGNVADGSLLTQLSDANGPLRVSGGITVLQPFAFLYGSNGLIKNSSPNDISPTGWDPAAAGTFANEANVAGTKFIYGAPVRGGGQAPAGLFWALDALVRVSFNPGNAAFPWQYDTLSQPTSILAKNSVIEHDGKFFWPGTDRFLFYNGVVQELPNQMNLNWFFENLNYAARNKIWGTKVGRWGELWWFYPRGSATECTDAVIFNYLENTWYDAVKMRSAGSSVVVFPYPIWAGGEDSKKTQVLSVGSRLVLTAQTAAANATLTVASTTTILDGWRILGPGIALGATIASHTATTIVMSAPSTAIIPIGTALEFSSQGPPFQIGDRVTGATTHATGIVSRATSIALNIEQVAGVFIPVETLNGDHGQVAKLVGGPFAQELDTLYQQEYDYNKIIGDQIFAIPSSFTSKNFGFAVAQPVAESPVSTSVSTRVVRIEPDYDQFGDLTISVEGATFSNKPFKEYASETCEMDDPFVDYRGAKARIVRVKVESNTRDGQYQEGKVQLYLTPEDERSGEET